MVFIISDLLLQPMFLLVTDLHINFNIIVLKVTQTVLALIY